jgi:hypothetical protein
MPNGSNLFATPNAPSTFYAIPPTSAGYSLRLFSSTDGGLTWIALANLTVDEEQATFRSSSTQAIP